MVKKRALAVDSPIDQVQLDSSGSTVAGVKLDPARGYNGVPALLKKVIDGSDSASWEAIKAKIDYMYTGLDGMFSSLDADTHFSRQVKSEIRSGKKLLFKPNLVVPTCIDEMSHGESPGNTACTSWPFIAAAMRWFHDELDIPYYKMAIGEAASLMSITAGYFSQNRNGARPITTEAVMEGKGGDFYGGWGFYFVRKYLAETHDPAHNDDPMRGYEESVAGKYLPPGKSGRRLMVYDLNRTFDLPSKSREVTVPGGVNFKRITLHKVVIGGNPKDPGDMKEYPGCVLVNVPRLKVHSQALFTNAIKNLGIGLYPMEASRGNRAGSLKWKYCFPDDFLPGMKTEIPHQTWVAKCDNETGLPLKDEKGEYIVSKTAGLSGTMVDVIKATVNQGVTILHVVDAIEPTNLDHTGRGTGGAVPEGFAFASLDPVAIDLLCARYMFKTVPMREVRALGRHNTFGNDFLQRVPLPKASDSSIITDTGFDSPLSRYGLFEMAEKRGLGTQKYHVVGQDVTSGASLASLDGHLGKVEGQKFSELITSTFYWDAAKMLWDMNTTALGYFAANDKVTGSSYRMQLMSALDENGDGAIDYNEMGKRGFWRPFMRLISDYLTLRAREKYGFLHYPFLYLLSRLKYSDPAWNAEGHDFIREFSLASVAPVAWRMSRAENEAKDPLVPGLTWGKGKWPSVQFANYILNGAAIYGAFFPAQISLVSAYGFAFQYADKTLNDGRYTGSTGIQTNQDAMSRYLKDVSAGAKPLDFTLYVPSGYGKVMGNKVANVEEATSPAEVFRAVFKKGAVVW